MTPVLLGRNSNVTRAPIAGWSMSHSPTILGPDAADQCRTAASTTPPHAPSTITPPLTARRTTSNGRREPGWRGSGVNASGQGASRMESASVMKHPPVTTSTVTWYFYDRQRFLSAHSGNAHLVPRRCNAGRRVQRVQKGAILAEGCKRCRRVQQVQEVGIPPCTLHLSPHYTTRRKPVAWLRDRKS